MVAVELLGDVAHDYPELVEALRRQAQPQLRRWDENFAQSPPVKCPWMEYEEDTNTFIIALSSGPGEGGVSEVAPSVLVTFDAKDRLVAIELEGDVAKEYPELVASLREQTEAKPLRRTGT